MVNPQPIPLYEKNMFIEIVLNDERWRPVYVKIPYIKKEYMISDYGRVYSIKLQRLLKINRCGRYPSIGLNTVNGDRKTYLIHKLVGLLFIDNSDQRKNQINHIDGIHENNYYKNLEWCTPKENISHAFKIGLRDHQFGESHHFNKYNEETVHSICKLIENGYKPDFIIKEVFGMCVIKEDKQRLQRLIKHIKRKERWTAISSLYNI